MGVRKILHQPQVNGVLDYKEALHVERIVVETALSGIGARRLIFLTCEQNHKVTGNGQMQMGDLIE